MPSWTCFQCGAQFPETASPPPSCPICEDERQFVNWRGQQWLTREELAQRYRLMLRDDLGVTGVGVEPSLAIGQRALLLREADGCVMWDCLPLATLDAVQQVRVLGGLKAIAVSHPHFYGAVVDWSEAFGNVPIYLHGDDRKWITRPHPAIVCWTGDSHRISGDIALMRGGGHFPGATMLHWRAAANGKGALFVGDIAMVAMDRQHVSFMYSYPNLVPLPAHVVERMAGRACELRFDRIYGAWWDRVVDSDGEAAVRRSAERYLAALAWEGDELEL